jgi:hypothetical protein
MVDIGAYLERPSRPLSRRAPFPLRVSFSIRRFPARRPDTSCEWDDYIQIKAREAAAALVGAHGEAPGGSRILWPLRSL